MTKTSSHIDWQSFLLPWLGRTTKRYTYLILKIFKENGLELSREQMMILKHLDEKDGLVQNDLAFITHRDKTSLTRIITKMETKDLLKRVQCKNDQRSNKIFITEKGRSQFIKAFPLVKKVADEMQKNISPEEIKATIEVLQKVSKNIIELEDEKK